MVLKLSRETALPRAADLALLLPLGHSYAENRGEGADERLRWFQAAVAAHPSNVLARNELGTAWQDIYLVSPIWRFWIGGDILTTACAGALMPSVDSVGRFFPLAIIYHAEPGEVIVPPPFARCDNETSVNVSMFSDFTRREKWPEMITTRSDVMP